MKKYITYRILSVFVLLFSFQQSFSNIVYVTNTNDVGTGSFRAAIDSVNTPNYDTVYFNITGAGPHTISLTSQLPNIVGAISDTVVIDGSSQQTFIGETGTGEVVLEGDGSFDGLLGSFLLIKNLIFEGFSSGVVVQNSTLDNLKLSNCGIGINLETILNSSNKVNNTQVINCTQAITIGNPLAATINSTTWITKTLLFGSVTDNYVQIVDNDGTVYIDSCLLGIDENNNTYTTNNEAIVFVASEDLYLSNSTIFASGSNAINAAGSDNLKIQNCFLGQSSAGIGGNIQGDAIICGGVNAFISNSYISNAVNDILQITSADSLVIKNSVIGRNNGNTDQSLSTYGINIPGVVNFIDIQETEIYNTTAQAIYVNEVDQGFYLENSTIGNIGTDAIYISQSSGTSTIKNNYIGISSTDEDIPVGNYGIYVTNPTTLLGNTVANTGNNGVNLSSNATGIVRVNTIHDINGTGIYAQSINDVTISSNTVYNSTIGIELISGSNQTIDSNLIYNNSAQGIELLSVSIFNMQYNVVYGNGQHGVQLYNSTSNGDIHHNIIGAEADSSWNTNSYYGLYMYNGASNHEVYDNYIYSQDSSALYMNFGASQNLISRNSIISGDNQFPLDLDTAGGPGNNGYMVPSITTHTKVGQTITLIGVAQANDSIEVFRSDVYGGGVTYLINTQADGSGNWTVSFTDAAYDENGENSYVATARDNATNNTSQFSEKVTFYAACNIVTNTNDSGEGSFRNAIECVNAGTYDTVIFHINGTGPHTINLNSELPDVIGANNRTIVIDGGTQKIFSGESGNGVIKLDGQDAVNGLNLSYAELLGFEIANADTSLTLYNAKVYGTTIHDANYLGVFVDTFVGNTLCIVDSCILHSNQNNILSINQTEESSLNITNTYLYNCISYDLYLINNKGNCTIQHSFFNVDADGTEYLTGASIITSIESSNITIDNTVLLSSGGGDAIYLQAIGQETSLDINNSSAGCTSQGQNGTLSNDFIRTVGGKCNVFIDSSYISNFGSTAVTFVSGADSCVITNSVIGRNTNGEDQPYASSVVFSSDPVIYFKLNNSELYNTSGIILNLNNIGDSLIVSNNTIGNTDALALNVSGGTGVALIKNNYFGTNVNGDTLTIVNAGVRTIIPSIIENNEIANIQLNQGLYLSGIPSVTILGNRIYDVNGSGIEIAGANGVTITNNTIYNCGFEAVYISSSTNIVCDSNEVFNSQFENIDLQFCSNYSLTNNYIYSGNGYGIELNNSSSGYIYRNYIGIDRDSNLVSNSFAGIHYSNGSSNNEMIENAIYIEDGNGIRISASNQNLISKNKIVNDGNGNLPIELNLTGSVGNDGYEVPNITNHTNVNQLITLSGSAQSADTVEVFRSDNYGNAVKYLRSIQADGSNNWTATFTDSDFDILGENHYVATARDNTTNNTSQLSEKVSFYAPCNIVTNTNDSGEGSFRNAIECVNAGMYDTVKFNISPNSTTKDTIKVPTRLPDITREGVVIDGTTEPGWDAATGAEVIVKFDSIGYVFTSLFDIEIPAFNGLNITNSNVSIKGLNLYGFHTGLHIESGVSNISLEEIEIDSSFISGIQYFGDSGIINNISIDKTGSISAGFTNVGADKQPFLVEGNENIIRNIFIDDCYTDSSDIKIIGDLNSIDSIVITNMHYNGTSSVEYARGVQISGNGSTIKNSFFNTQIEGKYGVTLKNCFNCSLSNSYFDVPERAINIEGGENNTVFEVTTGFNPITNEILSVREFLNITDSDSNFIYQNDIYYSNSSGEVIELEGNSNYNKISENRFFSNSPNKDKIELNGLNSGINAPFKVSHNIQNDSLLIIGKAGMGDTIEFYLSDNFSSASVLLDKIVAGSDSIWVMKVPSGDYFDKYTTNRYTATATDPLGNTSEFSDDLTILYSLCNIQGESIYPTDSIICKGDEIYISSSGAFGLNTISYTTASGLYSATGAFLPLSEEDTYYIVAEDGFGCTLEDTMSIQYDTLLKNMNFLLATEGGTEVPVIAIDVTYPEADSSAWVFSADSWQKVDDYYELTFGSIGNYDIQMISWHNGCTDTLTKSITIIDDFEGFDGSKTAAFTNEIESLTITPNPNHGKFEAEIIMNTSMTVGVQLYDVQKESAIINTVLEGASEYTQDFDLNLSPGVYILYAYTEQDVEAVKLVIQ